MNALDETSFAEEVAQAGEALAPMRANLLFAREVAYPHLRPSETLTALADLAESAARALTPHGSPATRALGLAEHLFGTLGYSGNRQEYSDPRNSYLHEVLTRKQGLPISLSMLYVHVAEQLHLPVRGVGMPGHFIVEVVAEDGSVFIDPFNGGQKLGQADFVRLISESTGYAGTFNPRWLKPTPSTEIVARMLNNLRGVYIGVEDWPLAARVLERLRELQPAQPSHIRDLGLVSYRAGSPRRAAELLTHYLNLAPEAKDADAVRQNRDMLWDELARLN
ncbi:MAG: tetratricopeptide repeat protein [Anaerolineales bacterium]|nr:tetratricopeptide repeat protein [Anaerolineales bacterium]